MEFSVDFFVQMELRYSTPRIWFGLSRTIWEQSFEISAEMLPLGAWHQVYGQMVQKFPEIPFQSGKR